MKLGTKTRIKRIFNKGKRICAGPLMLYIHVSDGIDKLGFVISKKAYPKAVDRNRIKRLVRASWTTLTGTKRAPLDCLCSMKSGVSVQKIHKKEVDDWLFQGLKKARLA
ncbi:ribonuclease P protein component [Elusimicrobiota bacterium]